MMAQKAKLFGDDKHFQKILQATTPKEVKELGRQVRNFDADIWEAKAFDIVVDGNLAKFSQNESLRAFLLSTSTQVLVEASPYDKIWGVGLEASHKDSTNPLKWRGENKLGFALMVVRERLFYEV